MATLKHVGEADITAYTDISMAEKSWPH